MITWIIVMVVLASVSFLKNLLQYTGTIPQSTTFLWAVLLDILLFLVALGMLYRMSTRQKMGEKERLSQKINELEEELKNMKD
jgi:uncharacterized membrane protein YqhA